MSDGIEPRTRASLVLPIYNAEAFLAEALRSVDEWIARQSDTWDLILVDDASTDSTPAILDAFVSAHRGDRVTHIRLGDNSGKGFAVKTGVAAARGRYVVFTDCDLTYPLSNVARLMEHLDSGADAAIACRVLPDSTYLIHPTFFSYLYTRHVAGRIFNILARMLAVPGIRDTQAGLKGFRVEAVRPLLAALQMHRFAFDVELLRALLDRGARIEEVPVAFHYRKEPSTVRFTVDAARMMRDLLRVRARSARGCYRRAGSLRPRPVTGVQVGAPAAALDRHPGGLYRVPYKNSSELIVD